MNNKIIKIKIDDSIFIHLTTKIGGCWMIWEFVEIIFVLCLNEIKDTILDYEY